jgi:hypothetical protein
MKCTLQNFEQKSLTKAGERERLALMTANVWVYNSTVYNAKGTTWSGSPLWKQARQEVRQHWFIYSYIAAHIQALYMYCPVLLEYTQLVWPPTRGVGRCPQYFVSSCCTFRTHYSWGYTFKNIKGRILRISLSNDGRNEMEVFFIKYVCENIRIIE